MRPAEAFPLGVHLREELDARGWTANDVARATILSPERVQEILDGIEPRLRFREAEVLGYALGVHSSLLLNLDMSYRKWHADQAS